MTTKEKKRLGIWLRVSTEDQVKGESPLHHEERARAFAMAKGWEIIEVYRLDAVSGKSVIDHPITQKMLRHVREGHIDALVFSKLARLARNTRELLDMADRFRDCEADLISLEESIDTSSPAGRVFFTMIAAMAQWEREEIAARVAASVPVRARLGKSTGGPPVYGYHWVEGQMLPHPEEAPVRKLIYDLYLKHRRKSRVAEELNERGLRTRKGGKFTDSTVGRLLKDTTAKGVRIANYTTGGTGTKRAKKLKPKEEWIEVPVEPIIDEALWDECNRILEESRKSHGLHRKRRKPINLFSGYVFCGKCGGDRKMYPQTGWDKYRCYKCTNKIAIDDLEALFVEQMEGFLLEEQKIKDFIEKAREAANDRRKLLSEMDRKVEKVEKKMDSLLLLHEKGALGVDEFRKRFSPLEEQKKGLIESVPRLKEEIRHLESDSINGEDMAKDGHQLVDEWPKMNWERRRMTVENLVHRILVEEESIDFELQYMPGQFLNNSTQPHLFNYAKGFSAEFEDPNGDLKAAVKEREGKIISRQA